MKLSVLTIQFESVDDFMADIEDCIFNGKDPAISNKSLSFDSFETFKRLISHNKIQVLIAISRLKPESIYQLEKLLNRQYPHVLKDCRQLENLGFIKLIESNGVKKQLRPSLVFEYDVIKVDTPLQQVFNISKRSNDVLLKAV